MVRDYRPDDLEAVVALFGRSVRGVAARDYSPEQIAAWAPEPPDLAAWAKRLQAGGVFVCVRDDRIAGFARIDDTGYVDLLYVDADRQRQGVGRALMDRVLAWAAERKLARLRSDVSITARRFFERVGFRVVRSQFVERRGVQFRNFAMERL